MRQTYLVEISYAEIGAIRDAIDLAHKHLMDHRILLRMMGEPVRKGPGPLRRKLVALMGAGFPTFNRYDPDPCFGIHNFIEDPGWIDVELPEGLEAPAHCTECGKERINA